MSVTYNSQLVPLKEVKDGNPVIYEYISQGGDDHMTTEYLQSISMKIVIVVPDILKVSIPKVKVRIGVTRFDWTKIINASAYVEIPTVIQSDFDKYGYAAVHNTTFDFMYEGGYGIDVKANSGIMLYPEIESPIENVRLGVYVRSIEPQALTTGLPENFPEYDSPPITNTLGGGLAVIPSRMVTVQFKDLDYRLSFNESIVVIPCIGWADTKEEAAKRRVKYAPHYPPLDVPVYPVWGFGTCEKFPKLILFEHEQGVSFLEWSTEPDRRIPEKIETEFKIDRDLTLYALHKYELKFNGGSYLPYGASIPYIGYVIDYTQDATYVMATTIIKYKEQFTPFVIPNQQFLFGYVVLSNISDDITIPPDETIEGDMGNPQQGGAKFLGWSTANIIYEDKPQTVVALYDTRTFRVEFRLDFKSSSPLIVYENVPYGMWITPPKLPASDIDNPNRNMNSFIRWSAPTSYITQDLLVVGIWDSSYVWIVDENHNWIKYEPKES